MIICGIICPPRNVYLVEVIFQTFGKPFEYSKHFETIIPNFVLKLLHFVRHIPVYIYRVEIDNFINLIDIVICTIG